jgi:adenylate cyclase
MAVKLVKLHSNHPKMYGFLNALVDIGIKGIPFFIMI